jgi:hypothetical protein
MSCSDLEVLAPDLALGQVAGDERAQALEHLDSCARCRELVAELSVTVDTVGALAPPAEPPAGFEARVLDRVDVEARRSARRVARARAVLIAAAVVIGALIVGGALWLRPSGSSSREVASYEMHTADGRAVGDAYVHQGDSTWVFVDVPGWTDGAPKNFSLRVTTDDGHSVVVPSDFQGGSGGWGTVVDVDAAHVRELALIGPTGAVWCSATVPA